MQSSYAAQEETRVTRREQAVAQAVQAAPPPAPASNNSSVSLSPAALAAARQSNPTDTGNSIQEDTEEALEHDPKYLLIKQLLEEMTGESVELSKSVQAPEGRATPVRANAVLVHETTQHQESERSEFHASGVLRTEDGEERSFSLDVVLHREERSFTSSSRIQAVLKDPLVVNYGTSSARLTTDKQGFDLDSDGSLEQINFLQNGSAFLALDKNGDGRINDGRELFGAQSGNGFADLAAYDEDQNQVIDENDGVFASLRLFNRDGGGQDQLFTLKEKDVGAILLQHASTVFSLKDSSHQLQGQIKSSGLYLRESGANGGVGSVQQLDLRV